MNASISAERRGRLDAKTQERKTTKIPRRREELSFSLSSLEPFFCWRRFIHLLSRQENPPQCGGVGHCGFGDADGFLFSYLQKCFSRNFFVLKTIHLS